MHANFRRSFVWLRYNKNNSQRSVARADLPGTGGWTHPSKASEWAWTSVPAWDTYTNMSFGKDASHLASEIGHVVTTSHQHMERKSSREKLIFCLNIHKIRTRKFSPRTVEGVSMTCLGWAGEMGQSQALPTLFYNKYVLSSLPSG